MIKLVVVFILFYIAYRLCKISSISDDKYLEDELFIKKYINDEE